MMGFQPRRIERDTRRTNEDPGSDGRKANLQTCTPHKSQSLGVCGAEGERTPTYLPDMSIDLVSFIFSLRHPSLYSDVIFKGGIASFKSFMVTALTQGQYPRPWLTPKRCDLGTSCKMAERMPF